MRELLYGSVTIIIYFVLCASSALLLRHFCRVPREVFRKLLHLILLVSLAVWVFAFRTWWMSVLSAVVFAIAVYPVLSLAEKIKGFSELLTERKTGEIKRSLLVVFGMYAIVASVCWGWLGDRLLALCSVFAWGFGDAAAALVGTRFGKHPINWKYIDGRKTAEGSLAMFAVSFFSVLVLLLLRGGLPFAAYMVIPLLTAFASALTELYTPNGMDTISCPLAAMATLLPLTALFGGIPV